MDKKKRNYIESKLKEYFISIPKEIDELNTMIYQEEQKAMVKGVSFDKAGGAGGISNDEKLAIIADNIQKYEAQKALLYERADYIVRRLRLYDLNEEQLDLLERIANKEHYRDVKKEKPGYSFQTIWNQVQAIYAKMEQYI